MYYYYYYTNFDQFILWSVIIIIIIIRLFYYYLLIHLVVYIFYFTTWLFNFFKTLTLTFFCKCNDTEKVNEVNSSYLMLWRIMRNHFLLIKTWTD